MTADHDQSGFDTRFVPLHYYNLQALNLMWSHLKSGTPLPPSQVIHTTPRGGVPGAAPALTTADLPAIAASPMLSRITLHMEKTSSELASAFSAAESGERIAARFVALYLLA